MPYTDDIAEEIDDMPASLREGTEDDDIEIPGEDVSQAHAMSNEDWIEPAKGVTFEIIKVLVDTYTPKDKTAWMKRSLKLYVAVDKNGVDGKGRYARKVFFPRILVQVNRDAYDFTVNSQGKKTNWYQPRDGGAWGEYNELLTALQFPTNPAPKNDAAFRKGLVGRKFVADISKDKREVYDRETGKSAKVEGEFENHLRNLRPVKTAATTEQAAEAAAS
jgi:hypothetical protein